MKITLALDTTKNSFVAIVGPEGLAVKSRCENSSAPNLILIEVPESALDPELVASLRQRIDVLEKDNNYLEGNINEMMELLHFNTEEGSTPKTLAVYLKELVDERDELKVRLQDVTLEAGEQLGKAIILADELKARVEELEAKVAGLSNDGETKPEEIITTQNEAKPADEGTD